MVDIKTLKDFEKHYLAVIASATPFCFFVVQVVSFKELLNIYVFKSFENWLSHQSEDVKDD